MKDTTKTISIEQVLTETQKVEIGSHLVKLVQDLELEQSAKASANATFNAQIKFLQKEISNTARDLNVGYRQIEVTARVETDSITGDKRYYDLVTGELLKTELNQDLEDTETINMFAAEPNLDEYGMSKLDYKILFREVYQVPLSISIETDLLIVGINHVVFEGYESEILEWLKSINIEEGYHQLHFEDTTPDMVTYKVENLSITNYQVRNYLESKLPPVENIFESEIGEVEEVTRPMTQEDFNNLVRAKYNIPLDIKITGTYMMGEHQMTQLSGDKEILRQWVAESSLDFSDTIATVLDNGVALHSFYGVEITFEDIIDFQKTPAYVGIVEEELVEELEEQPY